MGRKGKEKARKNRLKAELNVGSVNVIPITPSNRSAVNDYIHLLDDDYDFIKENFVPETFTKDELIKSKYTPSSEIEKIKRYPKDTEFLILFPLGRSEQ